MNNDLEKFSEERLKNIIELADNPTMTSLARIALAAKQAKPVGEVVRVLRGLRKVTEVAWKGGVSPENGTILYTTPQPAHTEQVIPDGWKLVPIEPTQGMVDAHISGMQSAGFSRAYRDMLAAAPKPESE